MTTPRPPEAPLFLLPPASPAGLAGADLESLVYRGARQGDSVGRARRALAARQRFVQQIPASAVLQVGYAHTEDQGAWLDALFLLDGRLTRCHYRHIDGEAEVFLCQPLDTLLDDYWPFILFSRPAAMRTEQTWYDACGYHAQLLQEPNVSEDPHPRIVSAERPDDTAVQLPIGRTGLPVGTWPPRTNIEPSPPFTFTAWIQSVVQPWSRAVWSAHPTAVVLAAAVATLPPLLITARSWWPEASSSLSTAALIVTSLRAVTVALLPWAILRQGGASRRPEAVLLGLLIGSLLSVLRGAAELVQSWVSG